MKEGLALSESSESKGFTLIELLIVIAVLGVLAAGVLIAINPAEQLARGRDSSRKTAVGQLARAVQAYWIAQGATYPAANNTWITALKNAGEVKSEPALISGGTACSNNVQSGYCYNKDSSNAMVYVMLESSSERSKINCVAGSNVYFMWNSAPGKTGLLCFLGEPGPLDVSWVGFTLQ